MNHRYLTHLRLSLYEFVESWNVRWIFLKHHQLKAQQQNIETLAIAVQHLSTQHVHTPSASSRRVGTG